MERIGDMAQIKPHSGAAASPQQLPKLSGNVPSDLWEPIEPRKLAIMLEETMALWQLPDAWPSIAKFYMEAFRDVPEDLVDRALMHARMNCKWCPKPADLLEPIRSSIASRFNLRRTYSERAERVERENERLALPVPEITEEQRAAERAMIDDAMNEVHETLPTREPPPVWRSESPGAVTRRESLRDAASRHIAGILDGSIPNPIETTR